MATETTWELGGYLEFEHFSGDLLHEDLIALNCGRGALAYLVELRGITSVWIPDLMCKSVSNLFKREGVRTAVYPVNARLLPDYSSFRVASGEWMLLMDYYGQLNSEDIAAAQRFSGGRLIVDESQGFFREPWPGVDTVYTCRKWFGVSDGAYLSTGDGLRLARTLPRDESHDRMGFLLGRFERPASEYFEQAGENNELFANEPPKRMSSITENILRAVDYSAVRTRRDTNWAILDKPLSKINALRLHAPVGAFMYPLCLGDRAPSIRQKLISQKIYIPLLWPDCPADGNTPASRYSTGVLPLPVDQRYSTSDMDRLLEVLDSCLS